MLLCAYQERPAIDEMLEQELNSKQQLRYRDVVRLIVETVQCLGDGRTPSDFGLQAR